MSKRPITFPKAYNDECPPGASTAWINHETGVVIQKQAGGYRPFRPADVSTGYIGIVRTVRTLAEARYHAARYVRDAARHAIAEAWDEAHVEDAARDDLAAGDRQFDAWTARHVSTPRRSAYWTIDAREADHAEALGVSALVALIKDNYPVTEGREGFLSDPGGYLAYLDLCDDKDDEVAATAIEVIRSESADRSAPAQR